MLFLLCISQMKILLKAQEVICLQKATVVQASMKIFSNHLKTTVEKLLVR